MVWDAMNSINRLNLMVLALNIGRGIAISNKTIYFAFMVYL